MMAVDFLPPHLIVLGGSYIGLEFAQAYRRFGSEVTVKSHYRFDVCEGTLTLMQRAMHIHPTVSEFVPTMMEDLMPLR